MADGRNMLVVGSNQVAQFKGVTETLQSTQHLIRFLESPYETAKEDALWSAVQVVFYLDEKNVDGVIGHDSQRVLPNVA